ncbi:unnamed protein product, partial [Mesorhabditis belari]|uniref:snRNA-activating protein complex subunit 4 n=1 Tax=Mesorhabditis belari TaxID=2138241 RepID=A0AAF3FI69_9BILA
MNGALVKEEKMDCADLQTPMTRKMSHEWSRAETSSAAFERVTEEMRMLLTRHRKIDKLIAETDTAISKVEANIEWRKRQEKVEAAKPKIVYETKFPVRYFIPPFFRGPAGNSWQLTEKGVEKITNRLHHNLNMINKRWTKGEIAKLSDAIGKEVVRVMMIDDRRQKEALQAKIDAAGQDTTIADILMWKHEIEGINRRAEYLKKQWGEYMENDPKLYEMIDWEKIATVDFEDKRNPEECRYSWENQLARWINTTPWQKDELLRLHAIIYPLGDVIDWAYVTEQLGKKRSAFGVFKEFRNQIYKWKMQTEWTTVEDKHLLLGVDTTAKMKRGNLQVSLHDRRYVQLEESIWQTVAEFVPGRRAFECRERFQNVLSADRQVTYWTSRDDYHLLRAVYQYGTMRWNMMVKECQGRNEQQCKSRWNNVLRPLKTVTNNWTRAQDEQILIEFGKTPEDKLDIPKKTTESISQRFLQLAILEQSFVELYVKYADPEKIDREAHLGEIYELQQQLELDRAIAERSNFEIIVETPEKRIKGISKTTLRGRKDTPVKEQQVHKPTNKHLKFAADFSDF